jgi:hypothetical protein
VPGTGWSVTPPAAPYVSRSQRRCDAAYDNPVPHGSFLGALSSRGAVADRG